MADRLEAVREALTKENEEYRPASREAQGLRGVERRLRPCAPAGRAWPGVRHRARVRGGVGTDDGRPGAPPDDEARRAQERERITRALAALPEHHRTIIMLSDLEGLSYRRSRRCSTFPWGR